MKTVNIIPILAITLLMSATVCAIDVYQSSGQRVSVLELYTSEGCSSCPPADRWFSELKRDERLWREFIPVAFHVDYWNYIGWKDRFSSPFYSDRQRSYAESKDVATIYTPGFILNGREWRSFFGLRELTFDSGSWAGSLIARVDQKNVQAVFRPEGVKITRPVLNIVIMGFDLVTQVMAGENHGKQLQHDFVVLGYKTIPMSFAGDGYTVTTSLPRASIVAPRQGIAVWINNEDDLAPIQAAGGWLP
jgi:Uncharacterized secreted protein